MDDRTAFERQVGEEIFRVVGPARPVDDFAIFEVAANRQKGWGSSTMISALKFVAAGAIVALFGGFLLTSLPVTPEGGQLAPAAVTAEPAEADVSTFPSGAFVSVENDFLMLEFAGDGTGVKHDLNGRTTSFTFAVDDDVYTWLTSDNNNQDRYGQAQYAWDYDGERLAFELLGEDDFYYRRSLYTENTFRLAEDPQVVVVAYRDIDPGARVQATLGFVPAAEAGPDALSDISDVRLRVAAVPISKGQVVTPELLEPMPPEATISATESAGPIARTDILPGVALTVEEAEPGVMRVLHDGVRDLAMDTWFHPVASKDGGVWVLDDEGFFRLGADVTHDWPNAKKAHYGFDVAPDGTVWTAEEKPSSNGFASGGLRIRSFDGETWTRRQNALATHPLDPFYPGRAFTLTSDGEVWASWADPDADPDENEMREAVVARFGADGWEPLTRTIAGTSGSVRLFVTDDEVWADPGFGPILRHVDGDWEPMTPEGFFGTGVGRVDVGSDGTVWLVSDSPRHAGLVDGCPTDAPCLMRYDGTDWQGWTRPDGLLEVDWASAYPVHAAPDGSVWLTGELDDDSRIGGVARFDGTEWRHFLAGRAVWAMDVADDGTVWLVVDSDETPFEDDDTYPHHLYVITP